MVFSLLTFYYYKLMVKLAVIIFPLRIILNIFVPNAGSNSLADSSLHKNGHGPDTGTVSVDETTDSGIPTSGYAPGMSQVDENSEQGDGKGRPSLCCLILFFIVTIVLSFLLSSLCELQMKMIQRYQCMRDMTTTLGLSSRWSSLPSIFLRTGYPDLAPQQKRISQGEESPDDKSLHIQQKNLMPLC